MGSKRHLGLGKAAKAKRQNKSETPEVLDASNDEITVELSEEADANDELLQLKALWMTYLKSEKENELVLNGIVHECDRLLRISEEGIPGDIHAIYAMALAEMARFQEDNVKVSEFFEAALERSNLGEEAHPQCVPLKFARSRILVSQIPLQFVSQLTVDSAIGENSDDLSKTLDEALGVYESAEKIASKNERYEHFNEENLEILQALDDLLEIVDNFGKDNAEGEASDDEDAVEGDNVVELKKQHPLYKIRNSDKYNQWWRDHTEQFLVNVDKYQKELEKSDKKDEKERLDPLRRELCKRLGQSYLQEAEEPSSIFSTLTYDDGFADTEEISGLTRESSQKISQDLLQKALSYFKQARDEEEPDTWANVAEVMISLGNLYDIDSTQQEELYQDAEEILLRANKATSGKYQHILENLQEHE